MIVDMINIVPDKPGFTPIGVRKWMVDEPIVVDIITKESGVLTYNISPGFITDFRSGNKIIDWLVPHVGSRDIAIAYLCHDIEYVLADMDGVSKKQADINLRQMLKLAGVSSWKCELVYRSVQLFGSSHFKYDPKMAKYISFEWVDK